MNRTNYYTGLIVEDPPECLDHILPAKVIFWHKEPRLETVGVMTVTTWGSPLGRRKDNVATRLEIWFTGAIASVRVTPNPDIELIKSLTEATYVDAAKGGAQ